MVEAVDVVAPLGKHRAGRVERRLLVRVVEDLEPDAGDHRVVVRLEVGREVGVTAGSATKTSSASLKMTVS